MWLWQTMTILIEKFAKKHILYFFWSVDPTYFLCCRNYDEIGQRNWASGKKKRRREGSMLNNMTMSDQFLPLSSPLFPHKNEIYQRDMTWQERRELPFFVAAYYNKEPLGWKFSTEMPKCGGWVVSRAVTNSQTKIYKILRKIFFPT